MVLKEDVTRRSATAHEGVFVSFGATVELCGTGECRDSTCFLPFSNCHQYFSTCRVGRRVEAHSLATGGEVFIKTLSMLTSTESVGGTAGAGTQNCVQFVEQEMKMLPNGLTAVTHGIYIISQPSELH